MSGELRRKIIERRKIAEGYFDTEIALMNELQRNAASGDIDFTNSYILIGLRLQRDKLTERIKTDPENKIQYNGIITLLDMAINRLERITTYD